MSSSNILFKQGSKVSSAIIIAGLPESPEKNYRQKKTKQKKHKQTNKVNYTAKNVKKCIFVEVASFALWSNKFQII